MLKIFFKSFFGKIPKLFLCIHLSFFFASQLNAQEIILRGKVIDKATNQVLSSVSVYDKTSSRGTTTDDSGIFKISLPKGTHIIEFSFIGFERFDTTFYLGEKTEVIVFLKPFHVPVGEVTITADGQQDHVSSTQMGAFTLTNIEMMKLPSLLGEIDPLKLLQLTPGIQSGSYGGVGFYVRGGGVDQNLILSCTIPVICWEYFQF
jgi:hypothetical protein